MDSSTSTSDENFEMGFRLSSPSSAYPTDQSFMEITSDAILSSDSFTYCRTNSEASAFDSSEHTDDNSYSEATSPLCWQSHKSPTCVAVSKLGLKQDNHEVMTEEEEAMDLEMELMKERLSKLLLGEDMSGSGKGVCTAVTISNAITNLYASVFGQHQKLEPMHSDKKIMWKREMNCLLSICDYLVEFTPAVQNFKDGTTLTVMKSRPRSDISMNLPALRKLDAMLLEILDSFQESEFWYADQGRASGSSTCSGSFRRVVHMQQHKEEKWWLPVPCVDSDGLSEKSKQHLRQKRDCASQIHKAAMAINSGILAEMAIPESYTASLPKSGKASVGDAIYRHMYSVEMFSPDDLLDSLNIRSEHEAIEVADRVEASMYTWRRKMGLSHWKSSWELVKDLVSDVDRSDKNHVLAERAGNLLFSLKQRYPELAQTTLDTSKIQYNKDVGQAVLESYSRVLEGLAFNIVAWIEDVVSVDCTTMNI